MIMGNCTVEFYFFLAQWFKKMDAVWFKIICAYFFPGLPDPYAKISVDGTNQTFSTEPCKATLHPTWNQYFDLYLTRTDSITISIWNHKKLHKEQHSGFLGCVHIVGKAVQRLRDAGRKKCNIAYQLSYLCRFKNLTVFLI